MLSFWTFLFGIIYYFQFIFLSAWNFFSCCLLLRVGCYWWYVIGYRASPPFFLPYPPNNWTNITKWLTQKTMENRCFMKGNIPNIEQGRAVCLLKCKVWIFIYCVHWEFELTLNGTLSVFYLNTLSFWNILLKGKELEYKGTITNIAWYILLQKTYFHTEIEEEEL